MKVTLVKGENWEALYVDGQKVLEHSTVSVQDALTALKINVPVGGVDVVSGNISAPAPMTYNTTSAPVQDTDEDDYNDEDEDEDYEDDDETYGSDIWGDDDDEDYDDEPYVEPRENGSGINDGDLHEIGADSNIDGLLGRIVFGETPQEKVYRDAIDEANNTESSGSFEGSSTNDLPSDAPKKGDIIYVRAVDTIFEKTTAGKATVSGVITEGDNVFVKVEGINHLFNWTIAKDFQYELMCEYRDQEAQVI